MNEVIRARLVSLLLRRLLPFLEKKSHITRTGENGTCNSLWSLSLSASTRKHVIEVKTIRLYCLVFHN